MGKVLPTLKEEAKKRMSPGTNQYSRSPPDLGATPGEATHQAAKIGCGSSALPSSQVRMTRNNGGIRAGGQRHLFSATGATSQAARRLDL
jgi:hypothetical protein